MILEGGIAAAVVVGGASGIAAYFEPLWAVLAVSAGVALLLLVRAKNARHGDR